MSDIQVDVDIPEHVAQATAFGVAAGQAAQADSVFVITHRTGEWLRIGTDEVVLAKREACNAGVTSALSPEIPVNPNIQGVLSPDEATVFFNTSSGPLVLLWDAEGEEDVVLFDVYEATGTEPLPPEEYAAAVRPIEDLIKVIARP